MRKKPVINQAMMDRHAYQVAHLISSFTVPMMRDLYKEFEGDMVQIIVLGEIALRNVSRFFDKTASVIPEHWLDDDRERIKFMQPCNSLSISDATGIPRETVRRKVNQLIQKGWLCRDENQYLMLKPGVGQGFTHRNAKLAQEIMTLSVALEALLVSDSSDR